MLENKTNGNDEFGSELLQEQQDIAEEMIDALGLSIEGALVYKEILSLCLKTQKRLDELRATLQQVNKITNEQIGKGDNSGSGFSKKDILDKRDASNKIDAKIIDTQAELQKIIETLMMIPALRSSRVQGYAMGLGTSGRGSEDEDM